MAANENFSSPGEKALGLTHAGQMVSFKRIQSFGRMFGVPAYSSNAVAVTF